MKAILTGAITALRYVDTKGGKVGQVDLLQAGDAKYPTRIVEVFIPSSAYCRLIVEQLNAKREPIVSFLVFIKHGKEVEIDLIEMLSIYSDEVS